MGSEKALLWSICLVIFLFISVMLVNYFAILHGKMHFDMVCQRYFWVCEQNVGLLTSEKNDLEEELKKMGYENIVIEAPLKGSVSRGEWLEFSVKASKLVSKKESLFRHNEETQNFEYIQKGISRQVVN